MATGITITILSWLSALVIAGIAVVLLTPRTRRQILDWIHNRFNADFSNPNLAHRILVNKNGQMIAGEGWRDAVRTGIIVGASLLTLLVISGLVLPNWWKLLGIAFFGGLMTISVGLWFVCLTQITEREVGMVFRKDHLYGFLRPGWYLVFRPFGFEMVPWRIDRNRREARDLNILQVMTSDNLEVGFDLMITMETMDLHETSPYDIRHPDASMNPATDLGAPQGAGALLAKKGEILSWSLQAPYLRVFRYQSSGADPDHELNEEIEKAANTISFLYCISNSWEELKSMFAKPSHTISREESVPAIEAAIAAAEGDKDKSECRQASLQQLIRNYLEPTLRDAGIRIVDVRVKGVVPPKELLATKKAELEGEAEQRKLQKITQAIRDLGDLANSTAANFYLTDKTIEAWKQSAGSSGAVIVGTPKELVEKLEIDVRRGTGSSPSPK